MLQSLKIKFKFRSNVGKWYTEWTVLRTSLDSLSDIIIVLD